MTTGTPTPGLRQRRERIAARRRRNNRRLATRPPNPMPAGFLHPGSSPRLAASAFHSWRGLRARLFYPGGRSVRGRSPLTLVSARGGLRLTAPRRRRGPVQPAILVPAREDALDERARLIERDLVNELLEVGRPTVSQPA